MFALYQLLFQHNTNKVLTVAFSCTIVGTATTCVMEVTQVMKNLTSLPDLLCLATCYLVTDSCTVGIVASIIKIHHVMASSLSIVLILLRSGIIKSGDENIPSSIFLMCISSNISPCFFMDVASNW